MKDIKELIRGILDAELVEQKGEIEGLTLRQMNSVNAIAWNVATRLIAAYLAEQEPLHVGDSQFESWFSTYWSASLRNGSKQIARDAYAAGMGDPLVVPAACAAPSSEEVREMVERLRNMSQGVWPYKRAADMIERLAARVDDLKQANDGLATAGILPDGCVVVQRKVTEDGRCALATPGNYRTYQDQWNALIAAGEVKTC